MRTEPFETKNHSPLTIRGEFFIPEDEGPFPTVVFFHGFTGTYKEGRNEEILRLLAKSGILGIGFDFTNEIVSSSSSNKCYNNLKIEDKKLVLFDNANHTYSDPEDQAELIKLLVDWFKDKLSDSI